MTICSVSKAHKGRKYQIPIECVCVFLKGKTDIPLLTRGYISTKSLTIRALQRLPTRFVTMNQSDTHSTPQHFFWSSKPEHIEKSTAFEKENNKKREEQSLFLFHCNCHTLNCWICKGLASPLFLKN